MYDDAILCYLIAGLVLALADILRDTRSERDVGEPSKAVCAVISMLIWPVLLVTYVVCIMMEDK